MAAPLHGASGGHVYGSSYAGAPVFDSGDLGPPDGFGVIQGNNRFSGDPIFNDNDGTVALIDPVATPRPSSPVAARAAIASVATPPTVRSPARRPTASTGSAAASPASS